MKFGKLKRKVDKRTLQFADYVTSELPTPPVEYSSLDRIYENLKTTDGGTLFPMDGNDTIGDCTIAGLAHLVTLFNGLVSKTMIPGEQDVEKLYFQLTGGDDSGLHCLDVLNYWRKNAFSGDQIVAYVQVDPKNHTHLQQAASLFGAIYLGFTVQENCISDFKAGKTWTPGTLTQDGHCVPIVSYSEDGVRVLTWGSTQLGNWAWVDETVDEAYAVLPPEAAQPGFSMQGFNITQLQADLAAVTG